MPNLTQNQALQIAQAFSGFANTVEDYRFAHFDALTDLQRASLLNIEGSLRTSSNDFLNMGVNLVLDNVQDALDGLGEVTNLLNHDLAVLADINKAIHVVGVLLQLGTAIATGNPASIVAAIGGAVTALTAAVPATAAAPAIAAPRRGRGHGHG